MTLPVRLVLEAEAELAEAAEWYEARGSGLGADFLRSFEALLALIERNPEGYPIAYRSAGRAILRRFPYNVIYTVLDNEIVVFACIHGRRDPEHWKTRI